MGINMSITLELVQSEGLGSHTLVNELVEGVLSVGSRFPPYNGSSVVIHTGARLGDVLPVGLHVSLKDHQQLNKCPTIRNNSCISITDVRKT